MKVSVNAKDIKLLLANRLGLDPKEIELEIDFSEPEADVADEIQSMINEVDRALPHSKIEAIKTLRAYTGLGLKETKDISEDWTRIKGQILGGVKTNSEPLNQWLKR